MVGLLEVVNTRRDTRPLKPLPCAVRRRTQKPLLSLKMGQRDTICLYNAGQFQKHISPEEASAIHERGEVDPIFEQRQGGPKLIGYQVRVLSLPKERKLHHPRTKLKWRFRATARCLAAKVPSAARRGTVPCAAA